MFKIVALYALVSFVAGAPVIMEQHVAPAAPIQHLDTPQTVLKYSPTSFSMPPLFQYVQQPAPIVKYATPTATSYATVSQVHVAHPHPLMAYHPYTAPLAAAPTLPYSGYPSYFPSTAAAAPVVKFSPHYAPW
ncbi:hypothetical protein DMENIID0001_077690 [Sergentomyia squamirostris]